MDTASTTSIGILAPMHHSISSSAACDSDNNGNNENDSSGSSNIKVRRPHHCRPIIMTTKTSLAGIVVVVICYFSFISLSTIHSSSSSSSSSIVQNPFRRDPTIVSGFGSRSIRKTIFSQHKSKSPTASSRRKKKMRKRKEDKSIIKNIDIDENDDEEFLAAIESSPKMWVQRSKYSDNDEDIDGSSDALWILIGDDDSDNDNKHERHGVVLKLTFDDEIDDWVAKKATKSEELDFIQSGHPLDEWVPIEGLYGIYKVPSGVLWILITKTEPIYDAPPFWSSSSPSSTPTSSSWWKIRRVTNLEIVHLGNKGYQIDETTLPKPTPMTMRRRSAADTTTTISALLTVSQLREEVRQLKLLRKSLKQHDFYYIPKKDSSVVSDMTKTIQQSILEANRHQATSSSSSPSSFSSSLANCDDMKNKNNNSNAWWWRTSMNDNNDYNTKTNRFRPDPRFFWNQHAVEPIIRRYHENNNDDSNNWQEDPWKKQQKQRQILADILLQHVVPLTSAFVGVQSNITIDSGNFHNDGDDISSSSGKNSSTNMMYDEILISRRSRFRAGTRFTVRGADASGDCANFAETEQICLTTGMTTNNAVDSKTKTSSDISVKTVEEEDRRRFYLRSVASHVQVRGSIPLRWSSPSDVKTYRPRVVIGTDPLAQARAVRLHVLDQLEHYTLNDNHYDEIKLINENNIAKGDRSSPDVADIVFLNLVDKHSDQGRLGRAFDAVLKAVVDVHGSRSSSIDKPAEDYLTETAYSIDEATDPSATLNDKIGPNSVKHVWYDFHAEVKHGRWDRLGLLLEELQPSLTSHGYFLSRAPCIDIHQKEKSNSKWSIQRLQNAVVRTNCMDCLDRTNVVQSIFGRYMLFQQLLSESDGSSNNNKLWAKLNKTFRKKFMSLPWEEGEVAHRLLWADNADAISRLYAGTPALKGDFTRTGQRTKRGALDDGMNSLQRYYLNNFLDADRQEGYDLMVGHAVFSNVIEEVPFNLGDGTKVNPSTHHSLSLFGGTRETILGDVVQGSMYQDREDLRKRLEEIGISKEIPGTTSDQFSSAQDLRWLPGDLQDQVRNQAKELVSNRDKISKDGANPRIITRTKIDKGGFSSQEALKAIDERSIAELPWWTKSVGDWLVIDDDEDEEGGTAHSVIAESSQHRSQVILTPIQLATVLFLGLRAPIILGSLAVVVLSFVYLPECIKHDIEEIIAWYNFEINNVIQ